MKHSGNTYRGFIFKGSLVLATFFCPSAAFPGVNVWTTAATNPTGAGALVVDPVAPSTVYAKGFRGVFKSLDGGATWRSIGLDDHTVTALAAAPPATLYAGTDFGAVFKSFDGGAAWSEIVTIPSEFNRAVVLLRIDPVTPTIVYRVTGQRVSVVGPTFGEVYRSTDGGNSWTQISEPLGPERIGAFAMDPSSPNMLFAAREASLFRSIDFGTTWTRISNGPQGTINALTVHPTMPQTIYGGTSGGVFKSMDGGLTFVRSSNGLQGQVNELVIDPVRPAILYAGTANAGVFVSRDGGATWTAMNTGLTDLQVLELLIDRSGMFLHAGTLRGVFSFQVAFDSSALSLNAGHRFAVRLTARDQRTGRAGAGLAIPQSDIFGYFSIPDLTFDPRNPEVFVKILDGRTVNGQFWVFYGGLTDLEYTLTVTDETTGRVRTYTKPAGSACGGFDTAAFEP